MSAKHQYDLDEQLLLLAQRLPPFLSRIVEWVRRPSSRLVRVPVGGLLVVGGLFWFLPIFSIWMLPLGLVLLARDIPMLAPPLARLFAWINRNWSGWKPDEPSDQPPR